MDASDAEMRGQCRARHCLTIGGSRRAEHLASSASSAFYNVAMPNDEPKVPAALAAAFPAFAGIVVVMIAAVVWWLVKEFVLPPEQTEARAVTLVAIAIVTAVFDYVVVLRVTRKSIERRLMPPVSPRRCALFILAAGAVAFLLPWMPSRYDSLKRTVSGPAGVVVLGAHLFMGWLAVRTDRRAELKIES